MRLSEVVDIPPAATSAEQDLVRTEVIAHDWDIAPKTLENWRSRRIGPPYIKINGVVRYSRRACAEWLSAQNVTASQR